jgi:helix-turn-helix protein
MLGRSRKEREDLELNELRYYKTTVRVMVKKLSKEIPEELLFLVDDPALFFLEDYLEKFGEKEEKRLVSEVESS